MRVAITGSSGFIGTALAAHLERGGHEVVRVRRGHGAAPAWDPAEGSVAPGTFEACDAIVNLSGASIGERRWTAARKAVIRGSRIDSTRLLVDHIGTLAQKPSVLVCASAVGYYGDRGDEVLDEATPIGGGFLAGVVRDWEAEARRAEHHGVRVAMARTTLVLATHSGAFPRLLLPFRLGAGGRLGSGRQWMPWVTLEDEVRAIEFALTHEAISGPFNVTAPQQTTNNDLTRALGRALHRPTLFPVPGFALRLLLGEMADELLLYSQRSTPTRLLDSGFAFSHRTLDVALPAVLGTGNSRPQAATREA